MTWHRITPRTGARSATGGVSCAWRPREKRMAVTISADVCRQLGAKRDDKKERMVAEIDPASGRVRLTLQAGGDWGLRWKDGCAAIHIPLDHLAALPPQQPARPAPHEIDAAGRRVVVTLPDWAMPPKPAPMPQRANKLPPEPELSPREQDEREAEARIRANPGVWHGRALAEEYGWTIQEAAAFAHRVRTRMHAEKVAAE